MFSSELAEKRFGCGLSPDVPAPDNVAAMLAGVTGPDVMAQAHPIEGFGPFQARLVALAEAGQSMRRAKGDEAGQAPKADIKALGNAAQKDASDWAMQSFARWIRTPSGFRERLVWFWADHFTARGRGRVLSQGMSPYVETAIRPNIAGRFEDLLIAAVSNPVMLSYLDQNRSFGPNSAQARGRGLNENLAREVLELHTLGAAGGYGQADVRQLAELLTGLTYSNRKGAFFAPARAEPGAETVLGRRYGDAPATVEPIHQVLRDLARHEDTARHIARKLAVHFVGDRPPADLVNTLETRFAQTGGRLEEVYAALLDHPVAWAPELRNVKPPFDFMASACRALAVDPARLGALKARDRRTYLFAPMALMGQTWQRPPGPDGWPEEDEAWITPQGLSARLRWAMLVPGNLRRALPDPRVFAAQALGAEVPEAVQFAAAAAERRMDGVGLVLASPAFQRR